MKSSICRVVYAGKVITKQSYNSSGSIDDEISNAESRF
jgi:hypothetical protein